MEGVARAAAVLGRVRQRLDDLQLLEDRARPAARDDHRERVLALRADVDVVDVQPVDLGEVVAGMRSPSLRRVAYTIARAVVARAREHPGPLPQTPGAPFTGQLRRLEPLLEGGAGELCAGVGQRGPVR